MNTFFGVNGGENNYSSLKISWGAAQTPIPEDPVMYVGDHAWVTARSQCPQTGRVTLATPKTA